MKKIIFIIFVVMFVTTVVMGQTRKNRNDAVKSIHSLNIEINRLSSFLDEKQKIAHYLANDSINYVYALPYLSECISLLTTITQLRKEREDLFMQYKDDPVFLRKLIK